MTLTVAALVLTNLLYLAGAVAVASLVSGVYVLRHRKPKSLESGIESFSRELRALAPERSGEATPAGKFQRGDPRNGPTARRNGGRRQAEGAVATATGQRVDAEAPSPTRPAAAAAAAGPVMPDPGALPRADVPPTPTSERVDAEAPSASGPAAAPVTPDPPAPALADVPHAGDSPPTDNGDGPAPGSRSG